MLEGRVVIQKEPKSGETRQKGMMLNKGKHKVPLRWNNLMQQQRLGPVWLAALQKTFWRIMVDKLKCMSGLLLQQEHKQEVKGRVYFLLLITHELISGIFSMVWDPFIQGKPERVLWRAKERS